MSTSPSHPIPKSWLVRKLRPSQRAYRDAQAEFGPRMEDGDELWSYDEPAPPDVNAGELGIALVRDGEPIDVVIRGIH